MAKKPKVDLFEEVFGNATPVKPKKKNQKKDRIHLDLSHSEAVLFDRFAASDTVLKVAQGKQKEAKSEILNILVDKLLDMWCSEGHRTANPQIITNNGRAILQARERLRFELPVNTDGNEGNPVDLLLDAGFSDEEAENISDEFETSVERRFVNLTKLREESPSGKKLVEKLLTLVKDNFSPEERGMLTESITTVSIKEGFLDRSVDHAGGDPEKLKRLLKAIRPEYLMSHIVWNAGDDDIQKATNAFAHLQSVPTTATPMGFTSDDGKWYAEAEGNKAILYTVKGDDCNKLGEKKCTGNDHARATCVKWMRDEAYRKEYLEKFATE